MQTQQWPDLYNLVEKLEIGALNVQLRFPEVVCASDYLHLMMPQGHKFEK